MKNANISNPSWFIGVVENNLDQRHEGRVQVRAFGVHGTIDEVPTADLPWAIVLTQGGFDFAAIPMNSWVFGMFVDGRDAQQPIIIGVIPQQYLEPINPAKNGWGVAFGTEQNRLAQGSRPEDFGQPPVSRLARGENLEETYILGQETNRSRNIPIAGGGSANLHTSDNLGVTARDDGQGSTTVAVASPTGSKAEKGAWIRQGLISRGMPAHLAEGVVLNMDDESGLNFSIEEGAPNVHGTKGWGLIQWTDTSAGVGRRTELFKFAAARGEQIPTADTQLDFLMHELQTSEKNNWAKVQNATSASQAASLFMHNIERPAAQHRPARDANYANGQSRSGLTLTAVGGSAPARMGDPVAMHTGGEAPTRSSFDEPSTAYNARYPYNRVIESASGHVVEIDDTPGAERVMVSHRSGAYMQMAPSTTTYKSTQDTFDINDKNQMIYVGGSQVVTIAGDCHQMIQGNLVTEVMGDHRVIVHGNHETSVAGQLNLIGGEDAQIRAARVSMESNVENTNIKVGKVLRFETTETIHFKTKNMFFTSEETMNFTVGTDFILKGTGKISVASDSGLFFADATTVDLKSPLVRIGGGDKVSIKAETVVMDDVIRMAEGSSEEVKESGLTPLAAEPATTVSRPAPTSRGIGRTGPQ